MPPASLDLSKPPLVTLIAGPTASGKSALALKMARETGAVIINADSQQLYADLRILTARPSPEDEALADHRLYGVADAAEAWSVGQWSRAALTILDELRTENRPAVLVGGTGLYFAALTRGLADIPPVPPAVRDQIEADYLAQGEAAFRTRLADVDPQAAQSIEVGDRQRLVRAKARIRDTGLRFAVPEREDLPERLDAVLQAIYAGFTAGWDDGGPLAEEALWLGRTLAVLLPARSGGGMAMKPPAGACPLPFQKADTSPSM